MSSSKGALLCTIISSWICRKVIFYISSLLEDLAFSVQWLDLNRLCLFLINKTLRRPHIFVLHIQGREIEILDDFWRFFLSIFFVFLCIFWWKCWTCNENMEGKYSLICYWDPVWESVLGSSFYRLLSCRDTRIVLTMNFSTPTVWAYIIVRYGNDELRDTNGLSVPYREMWKR